ncbi:MAG: 3-oxoacyl-ACP reductase FabG [Elusimicrobia bacterium]|nr:3-oxoacyl-ACP reductase FabG [Elusimicrobiota bacterium]
MRFDGKVVVVTGAAQGIGKAACRRFWERGAKVALWDLNAEKLSATARELEPSGERVMTVTVNVTDRASVDAAVKAVLARWEAIDVLINNAGITRDGMLHKLDPEDFDRVLDVNLKGVFHCGQAVAQTMRERGRGAIVNTASVVGVFGNVGQTNYAAAKAGVIGMTRTWAKELGRKGVRVNAVAPGFTATDMLASVPSAALDAIRERTPLGRLGNPEEIANAYLFLASEEASYVTGAVLGVDGGLVI